VACFLRVPGLNCDLSSAAAPANGGILRNKPKGPSVPEERRETIRQEIWSLLETRALSAPEISAYVGVREKDVYDHLAHILKTTSRDDFRLEVRPAECLKCGFVFKKRDKLRKPGRCPVCRAEQIEGPVFMRSEKSSRG